VGQRLDCKCFPYQLLQKKLAAIFLLVELLFCFVFFPLNFFFIENFRGLFVCLVFASISIM